MRTTTKTLTMGALSLLIAACEMTPDLETRTFAVQHLQPHEVGELIDPYVYGEREGAPGALSVIEGAVTIRETADNLAQIERVLAQFDQARPDVRPNPIPGSPRWRTSSAGCSPSRGTDWPVRRP